MELLCFEKLKFRALRSKKFVAPSLTLKWLVGGVNLPPLFFLKTAFSNEKVKPWFFVTFNIIINHIFPENSIEIPQVIQRI